MQHLEPQFAQILRTTADSKAAVLEMAKELGKAFLVDHCFIALKAPNHPVSQTVHWTSERSAEWLPAYVRPAVLALLEAPSCVESLNQQGHLVCDDVGQVLKSAAAECFSGISGPAPILEIGSLLVVETRFQGQSNGFVVLVRSQPYQWTDLEVHGLKVLADPVAIALSQSQLHYRLNQQARSQTVVDQLTRAVRSAWDIHHIFQLAVETTVAALQISRGLVLTMKYADPLFRNREPERIPNAKVTVACEWPRACEWPASAQLQASADKPPLEAGTWLNESFWVAECQLCQQIFLDVAEPLVISNLNDHAIAQTAPQITGETASIFNPAVMPALLLLPLENQGAVLGYLALQHHCPRLWLPEEVAFMKLVAAQLSTAIIQTRALRQVQALVDERTAQLKRSLDVQAKLYEKTRQQVEQLRQLNQLKDEFLSAMSHELRTPLTSMTLAIRMLRQADLPPDRRDRYLEILEQQCAQETNLINDLLALQKLESQSTSAQLQKIDLEFLLRDLSQNFHQTWNSKNLTLALELSDQPLTMCADLESLNRILQELLTNAGKYAEPGSRVNLKVSRLVESLTPHIVIQLQNVGAGILPEELPYIFEKFRRGQGVTQQAIQGTGLGLALVKGLTEHLNGAIAAASEPLHDSHLWKTCFTLTLPQSLEDVVCVNL